MAGKDGCAVGQTIAHRGDVKEYRLHMGVCLNEGINSGSLPTGRTSCTARNCCLHCGWCGQIHSVGCIKPRAAFRPCKPYCGGYYRAHFAGLMSVWTLDDEHIHDRACVMADMARGMQHGMMVAAGPMPSLMMKGSLRSSLRIQIKAVQCWS